MKVNTISLIVTDDIVAVINVVLMDRVVYIYINSSNSSNLMQSLSVAVSHSKDFISKSLLGNNLDQERMTERLCRRLNNSLGICQIFVSYNLPDISNKGIVIDRNIIEEKVIDVILDLTNK